MTSFVTLKTHLLFPELYLFFLMVIYLISTLFVKSLHLQKLNFLLIFLLLPLGVYQLFYFSEVVQQLAMNGMYIHDSLSYFLKSISVFLIVMLLIYSSKYTNIIGINSAEFNLLSLFSLLGQFIIISANNLLTIYLGIELLSLALISVVALRRNSNVSSEAAMKYFVLAALASGFMLYGMSMIYGITGSLDLLFISDYIVSENINNMVLVFGLVFLISGIGFKFGAVPFHMWVPDVYEGSSFSTALLLGAAPKIAAIALLLRLLAEGLPELSQHWEKMLLIMGLLSIILGNFVAIAQSNIKRLLGYSTIGHVGFILLAFGSGFLKQNYEGALDAYSSMLFYVITYTFSVTGAFGVLLIINKDEKDKDNINDLKGLLQKNPVAAWCMVAFMFSMAGVPPAVGFYAKFVVLESLISSDYLLIVVLAALSSVVGAFYYLRIVKIILFDNDEKNKSIFYDDKEIAFFPKFLISINGLSIIILGLFPGPIMNICSNAVTNSLVF
ncbi:MAG: NADH-quinone oxidoreductase subunit N [Betaproteobacteria bacterium TMED156]|nr:MAG: NADH-quinone oxidoreductase subunit N [Betaproteobacteria bacterium TMED156]